MSRPDVVNDFEAWATISSRLHGRSPLEQRALLDELGLGDVWKNANVAWAKALAGDIVEMRLHRAQRYAEICARVLDRDAELAEEWAASETHEQPAPPEQLAFEAQSSDELPSMTGPLSSRGLPSDALQATHRMRAHPDPPSSETPAFVSQLAGRRDVALPKRNQARTQTVDSDVIASALGLGADSVDRTDPMGEPVDFVPASQRAPDSGETSLMEIPVVGLPDPRGWSLEQFARYLAEQEAGQESREAIDARFGLDPGSAAALHRFFEQRMSDEPALQPQLLTLVSEHLESLHTTRR